MALHRVTTDALVPVEKVGFAAVGLREREDIQRLLTQNIEVVAPDTLIIAEEFSEWEDSRRRIDLLGIDKHGNLVVIELKRTDDGGHMELQAIRYAAMVSALTFERIVEVYGDYLAARGEDGDPMAAILSHLDQESADESEVGEQVRIVLVSADFKKEITTSVLWLNEQGLDITCVRFSGYRHGDEVFVDVSQVIPLPEAGSYTVQLKEKRQRARAEKRARDYTKYDVVCGEERHERLVKRRAIFEIVRFLADSGLSPAELQVTIAQKKRRFYRVGESVDSESRFIELARRSAALNDGQRFSPARWFTKDDDLIHHDGQTFAFSNQWGHLTEEVMGRLVEAYRDRGISFTHHR